MQNLAQIGREGDTIAPKDRKFAQNCDIYTVFALHGRYSTLIQLKLNLL